MNNLATNTFEGPNALQDFLNPINSYTPLVELPDSLNPLAHNKVRIFAKLMNMLPLGNIKSIPAFGMLENAYKRGELDGVDTVVEASSGNTVLSLGPIAKTFGIPYTKSYVSHEISPGKLKLLKLFGANPVVFREPLCADPADPDSRIYKARKAAEHNNWYNPGQYDNPDNPQIHERITGKQIWEQTNGQITLFASGLGTTGTLVGPSRYFTKQGGNIHKLGIVRTPNNLVPGLRTKNLLREISHDWKENIDTLLEIGTYDSYKNSLDMIRHGLMVGPSSGLGLAGIIKHLNTLTDDEMNKLRNNKGEIVAVFVCCDGPLPYIDEYFKYLEGSLFPKIENEELLSKDLNDDIDTINTELQISSENAYQELFYDSPDKLQNLINEGKTVRLKKGVTILDVRTADEYAEHHLPHSISIDHRDILSHPEEMAKELKGKIVYTICRSGNRSNKVANVLYTHGVSIKNISGGFLDWSEKGLPRWKTGECKPIQKQNL